MSIALEVKNSEENEHARSDKRQHSRVWFQGNSRESMIVVEAYNGGQDVLMVAQTGAGRGPHRSLGIGFLQTWGTKSCRHSLPCYFPFGLTNDRSSVNPS